MRNMEKVSPQYYAAFNGLHSFVHLGAPRGSWQMMLFCYKSLPLQVVQSLASLHQECTVVFSVKSSSLYSIQGYIQSIPFIFLVDTGSIISFVKSAIILEQVDPRYQQLTPYIGPQLVRVKGIPLSVWGKASANTFLWREQFQLLMS